MCEEKYRMHIGSIATSGSISEEHKKLFCIEQLIREWKRELEEKRVD